MPNIGQQHSIEKLRQLQRNLYLAAKKDKQHKFHALYDRIFRLDILWRAWKEVRENKGSAGIGGITFEMIEEYGVEEYLLDIQEDLQNTKYRPKPVKRVYIPKPDGKQRPLGIPTIRDRIVQQACKIVIEPVFEANFLDSSCGFRPKRDAKQATEKVKKELYKNWYVVDADNGYKQESLKMGKLKMTLNPQKTKIVDMNRESFDFLGFRYQKFGKTKCGRKLPYMMPGKKVKGAIRVITSRKSAYEGLEQKVEKLNPLIRGWRKWILRFY